MTLELAAAIDLCSRTLDEANVVWAIGGSAMLKELGLLNENEIPSDLDLLIALPDAEAVHDALQAIGKGEKGTSRPPFHTRHFCKYRIGDCDIDVLAGFRIEHEDGLFELPFDSAAVSICNKLPYSLPEDWWLVYALIASPPRQIRAQRLYRYLSSEPSLLRASRLQELSKQPLPVFVRAQLNQLINKV